MALSNAYTVTPSRIPDVFSKIRDGQAPEQFTLQLLKDWGFESSNDRALLPILKAVGFLSPDGKPTSLYHDYRDHSRSKAVMGTAIKNAYGDIFLIKEKPTDADKEAIQGKFKSYHNVSENVASLMARTFLSLLSLADISSNVTATTTSKVDNNDSAKDRRKEDVDEKVHHVQHRLAAPGLHYNIQIHLPASKDVEVYNSIFKSLKEHLFDK